jgi:hypothetical protein
LVSKREVVDEVNRILSVVKVNTADVFTVGSLCMMQESFESSELGSDRGPVGIEEPSLLAAQHGHVPGSHYPDLPPRQPRNSMSWTNL